MLHEVLPVGGSRPDRSATPGYTTNIASYSSVGGDVAAPGGDYFAASNTVQDAILGAVPPNSDRSRATGEPAPGDCRVLRSP